MGFGIGTYRGARTLRTTGGDFGAATELVLYPDQKLAVAVLCNMDSAVMGGLATVNATDLTNGVADVFFDDVLEPRRRGASAPSASAPPPPVSLSADELASKTGLYRAGIGGGPYPVDYGPRWQVDAAGFLRRQLRHADDPHQPKPIPGCWRHARVLAGRSRAASGVARHRRRRASTDGASVDEVRHVEGGSPDRSPASTEAMNWT